MITGPTLMRERLCSFIDDFPLDCTALLMISHQWGYPASLVKEALTTLPHPGTRARLSWKCFPPTGRLQCHLDQVEDITRLAKQCQLNELIKDLQENVKRVLSFGEYFIFCASMLSIFSSSVSFALFC